MKLIEMRCTRDAPALAADDLATLLPQVGDWSLAGSRMVREFGFRNYHETMEFVNALAWVSHTQDHHPELVVTYKACRVSYSTHSAGGAVSLNDFVCAARADAIYSQRAGA